MKQRADDDPGVRYQTDRALVTGKLSGLRVYVNRLNVGARCDQNHTEQGHDSNRYFVRFHHSYSESQASEVSSCMATECTTMMTLPLYPRSRLCWFANVMALICSRGR